MMVRVLNIGRWITLAKFGMAVARFSCFKQASFWKFRYVPEIPGVTLRV